MNIIFIAPPAAGKGTQAKLVCDKYNLLHISTGDLLREITKNNNEFSEDIKSKMNKGLLINDDIIVELITDKLSNNTGLVFDGFPRNLNQAKKFDEILSKVNQKIDYIIYLEIDEEIAKKRILERMICPYCNNVYNINLDKINDDIYCNCGNKLVKREDDTLEVFMKRFEIYKSEIQNVVDYYKDNDNFYIVNSNLTVEEVFQQIENIIGEK